MAVPCRNRRLFRRVFRSHRCVQSVVSLNFREGRGSYALRKLIRYSCIYEACMSPALNGSSAIRRFERSDAIEIHDGITFDFYMGLPHIVYVLRCGTASDKVFSCKKLRNKLFLTQDQQLCCSSSPWAETYFVLYLCSINHPDYHEIYRASNHR